MANPTDSLETSEKEISDFLCDGNEKTVVLFAEAGVGKTWMAKEIVKSASLEGRSYPTIWLVPGYNYDVKSLVENIAVQLSVFSSNEEWEEDGNVEMEQQEQEVHLKRLKQRILEKLDLMKSAKLKQTKTAKNEEMKSGKPEPKATGKVDQKDAPVAGKDPYLLVVLDDIIYKGEKKILADLSVLLRGHLLKVLITRRGGIGNEGKGIQFFLRIEDHMKSNSSRIDSSKLLRNRVKEEVCRATAFERLSAAIGKSSSGHPGAIIMMAETMNHVKDSELDNAVE